MEAGLAKAPIPQNPSIKDWLINFGMMAILFGLSYFPFEGTDATRNYKPTSIANAILYDSPTTYTFWVIMGCLIIYLSSAMFYIIKTEYHLTFNKGNRHD